MARFGLCGPAYRSQSLNADAQVCLNWYVEQDESGVGASQQMLYPTPGLKVFATLADVGQIRGVFQCTVGTKGQRMFAVGDATVVEIFPDGTYAILGSVTNDRLPVTWAVNNALQLILCSGGNLYVYPIGSSATQGAQVTRSILTAAITNSLGNLIASAVITPNSPMAGQSTVQLTSDTVLNFEDGAAILVDGMTVNTDHGTLNGSTVLVTLQDAYTFSFIVNSVLTMFSGVETGGACVAGSQAIAVIQISTADGLPMTYSAGNDITLSGMALPYPPLDGTWTIALIDGQLVYFTVGTMVPFGPETDNGTCVSQGTIPLTQLTQVNIDAAKQFSRVVFMDGYFIALVAQSQQFAISQLEDGTTWDQADVAQVEEFPDNVVSMIVNQEILWFLGETKLIPYYDSGNANFPFVPVESILVENGIGAANSVVQLDNSVFWLDKDERGNAVARRLNGYTPQRVSTHAMEWQWRQYSTISDAAAYPYQDQGHSFWVIDFPTAKATWVYDVATNSWHQRDRWTNGQSLAHPSWTHAFCFGKHLVGDPLSGKIYDMSIDYYDNAGETIRRLRRAPHISVEQERIYYDQLQVYLESGLGPPKSGGNPSGVPFITEADDTGQMYKYYVDDKGILHSTAVSSGTVDVITLLRGDGTLWLLGAEAGTGRLTATQVDSAYQPVPNVNFVSPGRLQWAMYILQSGQMQIAEVPLTIGPQLILRWSDDGGHSWSGEHLLDCGKIGEYRKRVIMWRMGRARDRVFEISVTDPIPWRIIDAYLQTTPGVFKPQERLAHQYLKVQ